MLVAVVALVADEDPRGGVGVGTLILAMVVGLIAVACLVVAVTARSPRAGVIRGALGEAARAAAHRFRERGVPDDRRRVPRAEVRRRWVDAWQDVNAALDGGPSSVALAEHDARLEHESRATHAALEAAAHERAAAQGRAGERFLRAQRRAEDLAAEERARRDGVVLHGASFQEAERVSLAALAEANHVLAAQRAAAEAATERRRVAERAAEDATSRAREEQKAAAAAERTRAAAERAAAAAEEKIALDRRQAGLAWEARKEAEQAARAAVARVEAENDAIEAARARRVAAEAEAAQAEAAQRQAMTREAAARAAADEAERAQRAAVARLEETRAAQAETDLVVRREEAELAARLAAAELAQREAARELARRSAEERLARLDEAERSQREAAERSQRKAAERSQREAIADDEAPTGIEPSIAGEIDLRPVAAHQSKWSRPMPRWAVAAEMRRERRLRVVTPEMPAGSKTSDPLEPVVSSTVVAPAQALGSRPPAETSHRDTPSDRSAPSHRAAPSNWDTPSRDTQPGTGTDSRDALWAEVTSRSATVVHAAHRRRRRPSLGILLIRLGSALAVPLVAVVRTAVQPSWWSVLGAVGLAFVVLAAALTVLGVRWVRAGTTEPYALFRRTASRIQQTRALQVEQAHEAAMLLATVREHRATDQTWGQFESRTGLVLPVALRSSLDPAMDPAALVRYLASRQQGSAGQPQSLASVVVVPWVTCLLPAAVLLLLAV